MGSLLQYPPTDYFVKSSTVPRFINLLFLFLSFNYESSINPISLNQVNTYGLNTEFQSEPDLSPKGEKKHQTGPNASVLWSEGKSL